MQVVAIGAPMCMELYKSTTEFLDDVCVLCKAAPSRKALERYLKEEG